MDDSRRKENGELEPDGSGQDAKESQGEEESTTSKSEQLRRQIEARESEYKELYDRFLRQAAELENFKKRAAREKEETIRYANEVLLRDLLPVLDNLERAVEHAKRGENGKPLQDGIELVLKGFLDVLGKHGVVQITARGEHFDPEKHEAIAQVESFEHEPNTVILEHHKGYYLMDRLLRPALVTVSKPAELKENKNAAGEVEKDDDDD